MPISNVYSWNRFWISVLVCLPLFCAGKLVPGTDTAQIKKLIAAAEHNPDPDSAITMCLKLADRSDKAGYRFGGLYAWHVIGIKYLQQDSFKLAGAAFRNKLRYAASKNDSATFLTNVATTYIYQGAYTEASEILFEALKVTGGDTCDCLERVYADIYAGLAVVYQCLKGNRKRHYYLNAEEAIIRKSKLEGKLETFLINKSSYFADTRQYDSALICISEMNEICTRRHDTSDKISVYQLTGRVYKDSGNNILALAYYDTALALVNKSNDYHKSQEFTEISYARGDLLFLLGRYKEAEAAILPAFYKARASNQRHNIADAYITLGNVYEATGQLRKALTCDDSVISIRQELTGIEKSKLVDEIEMAYSTAEKDKRLAQTQLIIARQNERIAQKNTLMIATGGAALLLLLLLAGGYFLRLGRQRSRQKENKIAILRAAVVGSDNERSRIARELHDGIGGMLSAAMMRFSTMHYENPEITQTAAYNDAMKTLGEMGDEIRKTAHNLMPEVLLKQSLPEAVRIFCDSIQQSPGLSIDFQSFGNLDNVNQSLKLNIYRIVQELVKNVIKHADATRVLVQLLQNGDKLIVSVEDNGSGMNINETEQGMGLHNVRTRAGSLDGHFILESEQGKGTTVIVEFTIPADTGGPAQQEDEGQQS